jgi:molybdopterin/thiamine biosynthesis adenylyltransferase
MTEKTLPRVTIVGVGALGSHVALLLRNEAHLHLVDFDRVEAKNTLGQLFGRLHAGKNKAQVMRDLLAFMFGTKADATPHRLTSDNLALLDGSTLVLDLVDNGKARRLIQAAVREKNLPCLHGAIDDRGQCGRVVWDERFVVDDEDAPGAPTCEGGEFLPFVARTASAVAYAAQRFLQTGEKLGFHVHPMGEALL